jgi:DNA-binding NarL/FixJ family response regulator
MPIQIIIADDHQLFREGLVNLLSQSDEIEIIAQAEDGKDAVDKTRKFNPDIVLMDIAMPVMNGVVATELLNNELPDVRVIALSMHSDKQYIKGMLEAGAYGYLFKNCTYDQLIEAVMTVHDGNKYLSDKITEVILDDYLGKESEKSEIDPNLTSRESEVLELLAEGKSIREISETLFVSIKTIGTHKQNILDKLNLKTTTDLVKYAIKKGIIHLD